MHSAIRLFTRADVNKDMRFESNRLRYRGITERDAETIVAWRSDPDNYQRFFNARPITLSEHLAWFDRYLGDATRYDFMILDEEGLPIGTCGLSSITSDSCEISYMIGDKKARGRGYAKEAVSRLTQLAFDELGVSFVEARVVPGNDASVRVLLGGGYAERERVFRADNPRIAERL